MDQEQLIFNIKIAQSVQRYDDMVQYAKQIQLDNQKIDPIIQDMILNAYKQAVNQRRSAYDKLINIQKKKVGLYPQKQIVLNHCTRQIQNEMIALCNDIIQLINNYFLIHTQDIEEQSQLLLLLGDYQRYLCEIMDGNMKLLCQQQSLLSYKSAYKLAQNLSFLNCTRLTIYLNYSLFYYSIIKDYKYSYEIAIEAYNNAVSMLDQLDPEQQIKVQNILMKLNNNLTNWSADNIEQ